MSQSDNVKDYSSWFADTFTELMNYGLWLRGGEMNTLDKKEFSSRPYKVLFTRLSSYEDVGPSFTHSLLYEIAAGIPSVFPDLAYLPPPKDAQIFERDYIPWLLGTNTKKGPESFDLIGFSNSIVQEILNIPQFLEKSGIPLERSKRIKNKNVPLVILGGANALYTSSIWGKDPLVDGIFLGDSPLRIREILSCCSKGKSLGKTKSEILKDLQKIPGFFIPDDGIPKAVVAHADIKHPIILERGVVSYNKEQLGEGFLQISEGCRSLCSFCAESWGRKPYRESDRVSLLDRAFKVKASMGVETLNVSSFNFNMHSDLYGLLQGLLPLFQNVSLKSQRFDMLASDPEILDWELAAGKTTISCGLEGISPRLRRYLNKNLNEDTLKKSLSLVFEARSRELKIFVLATGLEEEEDFLEFEKLLSYIYRQRDHFDAKTRVIISITPLVRFPWTPLEFDKAYGYEVISKISKTILRFAEQAGFEAREAMDAKEYLVSQILVRAADKRIKSSLLKTLAETSFVYYRAVSRSFFDLFMNDLKDQGLNIDDLLCEIPEKKIEKMPWSGISTGIKRSFLFETFLKNKSFEEIGPSLGPSTPGQKHPKEKFFAFLKALRKNVIERSFSVVISPEGKGLPRKYIGLALASSLMKADHRLAPFFREYVSSFWDKRPSVPVWLVGSDIITLSWISNAEKILDERLPDSSFIAAVNRSFSRWGKLEVKNAAVPERFSVEISSPFPFDGANYLKGAGLKFTLNKKGDDLYSYEFTKDAVKKRILFSLTAGPFDKEETKTSFSSKILLVAGEKFDAETFAKECFPSSEKDDWVKNDIVVSF